MLRRWRQFDNEENAWNEVLVEDKHADADAVMHHQRNGGRQPSNSQSAKRPVKPEKESRNHEITKERNYERKRGGRVREDPLLNSGFFRVFALSGFRDYSF
jgi:hypothetical protein